MIIGSLPFIWAMWWIYPLSKWVYYRMAGRAAPVVTDWLTESSAHVYRWAGYKAAKAALDNVLQVPYVSSLNQRNMAMIRDCLEELKGFLMEGVLTEQFVTDNIGALIDCMRKCNVALRWRMLHRRTTYKKFYEMIVVSKEESKEVTNHPFFCLHVSTRLWLAGRRGYRWIGQLTYLAPDHDLALESGQWHFSGDHHYFIPAGKQKSKGQRGHVS